MHHATQFLLWGGLAFTLTIVGCEAQGASKSEVRDPWKVKTIHRDDYDNFVGRSKDVVELNNGDKVPDLGYNVDLVGEIVRAPNPPILLFFANDCLECEPGHFIIVYSPESRDKVELYHSGEHTEMTGSEDLEVVTLRTRLYYGSCLKDWRGVRIGSAWRLVVSSLVGIPIGVILLGRVHESVVNIILVEAAS